MALYAIGDLHLSLGADKSMEVFGEAWQGYVGKIETALSALNEDDVLVLAGDTSWGIDLAQAEPDFRFLDRFPCKKYLVKGNHDYWWGTASKMKAFFREKGITTLDFLHNNCQFYGDYALCGTRGWTKRARPTTRKCSTGRFCGWRPPSGRQGSGRSSASSITRPFIRAMSARRSWRFWSSTG